MVKIGSDGIAEQAEDAVIYFSQQDTVLGRLQVDGDIGSGDGAGFPGSGGMGADQICDGVNVGYGS